MIALYGIIPYHTYRPDIIMYVRTFRPSGKHIISYSSHQAAPSVESNTVTSRCSVFCTRSKRSMHVKAMRKSVARIKSNHG